MIAILFPLRSETERNALPTDKTVRHQIIVRRYNEDRGTLKDRLKCAGRSRVDKLKLNAQQSLYARQLPADRQKLGGRPVLGKQAGLLVTQNGTL